MNKQKQIIEVRKRRQQRVRANIKKSSKHPRLSVFRSGKHIYAQVIDDALGKTLASASDREIKTKGQKIDKAVEVGKLVAKKCLEKKINQVIFDKGPYKYHGRVAALASGAREAGLKF